MLTSNDILYLIIFIAIFIYLLKIQRVIYYFIFSTMILVFYMVSKDMSISISSAGIITALIYVFLDREPLKRRKSRLILEHMSDKKSDSKEEKKDLEEEFEPKNDHKIDAKNSYLELFKSLKPEEINSLNTDTKELIKTQQQLIETLQSMGPALKEGKTILDTFKNYFNDGSAMDKLSL